MLHLLKLFSFFHVLFCGLMIVFMSGGSYICIWIFWVENNINTLALNKISTTLHTFSNSLFNEIFWFWIKTMAVIPYINTLRPRQDGRHFADDTSKRIFLNENVWIPIKISLKFVPKGPINNNPALVQIMAWRRSGDKPLSEPMMASLLTHIRVTRPQWVNSSI